MKQRKCPWILCCTLEWQYLSSTHPRWCKGKDFLWLPGWWQLLDSHLRLHLIICPVLVLYIRRVWPRIFHIVFESFQVFKIKAASPLLYLRWACIYIYVSIYNTLQLNLYHNSNSNVECLDNTEHICYGQLIPITIKG